jgi:hypothetical protein
MSAITISYKVEGFLKVYDPNSGEVFVDKKNAINYENMSEAIADTLSSRGYGEIYEMAFGNGGASVDETGVITYLPPNTTGQNASLYNQTYTKIVDDTSVFNLDPTRNKMTVSHTTGKVYTDILVQCLLDYGEPAGQNAFDNSTQTDGEYVFDELGLLANYGTDNNGNVITRLLTHVIFHPVQKSLNRQIQIDYTVRIQALTNLVTI